MNKNRKEFLEDYGDVEVSFVRYYKYQFTYKATLEDGRELVVVYGDNDIYREDLRDKELVKSLAYGDYTHATIDGTSVKI